MDSSIKTRIVKLLYPTRNSIKKRHKNSHGNKNEDKVLVVATEEETVCSLCLEKAGKWFVVDMCGCRFCQQCMELYTHFGVRSGNVPLECPSADCRLMSKGRSRLSFDEIRSLVPSLAPLFSRILKNREVAADPNLMWCPQPDCETVCTVKKRRKIDKYFSKTLPIFSSNKRKFVECSTCHYTFCSHCKCQWDQHELHCLFVNIPYNIENLKNTERETNEDALNFLEFEGRVKRCPFCKVPIERADGCAQMMCHNCHHVFCWYCLQCLDGDFMLRHYDSGPCSGLLGHSRMSVVWHRAKVVAGFLGIGVLFLVNAPLLLLCSPCLVIWRRQHNIKVKSSKLKSKPKN